MDLSQRLDDSALGQALDALLAFDTVTRIAASLGRRAGVVVKQVRADVVARVPEYSASGNPELLPDLDHHATELVAELRRLLHGGAIGDFAFVRAHAQRRAEQHFPLEATLHAYRCAHEVLSQWLLSAMTSAGSRRSKQMEAAAIRFLAEYINTVCGIAVADYVAHTRDLAGAEGDRRTELLSILVSGYDESDGRVARLLKRAGYLEQRQSFCVALAQSVDPVEMENPARAQRIVAAILEATAASGIRVLAGVRNNVVTALFSDVRRLSGWTAPGRSLADRIKPQLLVLGPAVLIGLSGDQPSTSFIPRGVQEATVALDFAGVAERVVQFSELPIRRLLLHRGADYVQAALPTWFVRFKEADARSGGSLVRTLRTLADADLNVQRAARVLAVHPNTVYARMQRINDLTGLDAQRYHQLTELLLAADCGRL